MAKLQECATLKREESLVFRDLMLLISPRVFVSGARDFTGAFDMREATSKQVLPPLAEELDRLEDALSNERGQGTLEEEVGVDLSAVVVVVVVVVVTLMQACAVVLVAMVTLIYPACCFIDDPWKSRLDRLGLRCQVEISERGQIKSRHFKSKYYKCRVFDKVLFDIHK